VARGEAQLAVTLVELALYFGLLSLISLGGMPSVMPEMQRFVVEVNGWLTPSEFIQAFAVGQAAPGPNVLVTSLIGWKVAGIPGAVVALLAFCFPAAVIAWWVAELWDRFKDAPWRRTLQRAIAPIVVSLILSGGFVIATPGAPDWRLWLIAGASAAGMLLMPLNPLWLLAAGGALGALLL
jgi:chromate transporter